MGRSRKIASQRIHDAAGRLTDLTYSPTGSDTRRLYAWDWDRQGRITDFTSAPRRRHGRLRQRRLYQRPDRPVDRRRVRQLGSLARHGRLQLRRQRQPHQRRFRRRRQQPDDRRRGLQVSVRRRRQPHGPLVAYGQRHDATGPGDTDITTYTWDNRNRLTKVETFSDYAKYDAETPDKVVEYTYDYANRWLGETITVPGETTTVTQTALRLRRQPDRVAVREVGRGQSRGGRSDAPRTLGPGRRSTPGGERIDPARPATCFGR